jgi:hypothetical protein
MLSLLDASHDELVELVRVTQSNAEWGQEGVEAVVDLILEPLILRVRGLAEEIARFGPWYGPVDGTGKPDPNGQRMVDMTVDGLVFEIRKTLRTELVNYSTL